jgi:hypothetical protein
MNTINRKNRQMRSLEFMINNGATVAQGGHYNQLSDLAMTAYSRSIKTKGYQGPTGKKQATRNIQDSRVNRYRALETNSNCHKNPMDTATKVRSVP